ncbi:MAG TPA: xanthine dehydrogenase family protein molybdopterin-binding subunit [Vicinamibacterales bacterium]|jgi:CO/xanthine dehydrogenase Mo-binding subunit|nr:xanthine dehydrogenase family protein molybdopterin-binding subunit [Vicinamibacterales bacterium]
MKLIGHNYTTPDLVAKVTGRAKYAEDYRVDGMLFAKLLLSPMPHARVKRMDLSAAAAMAGVKAILTVDDLPAVVEGANLGEGIIASTLSERGLTNEPLYVGDPVLAVAAVDEATATEAIEKIHIDWEPLPFVVDPLESLRPGSPNARTQGNVWVRPAPGGAAGAPAGPQVHELKWTAEDFAAAKDGQLPLGKHTDEWIVGDLDAGFKEADLVLDETFVGANTSHQPLETRTSMAYWQNGKLYMHCSTQSTMRTVSAVARWVGIDPSNVVIISEYTGGGFGSKGSSSVFTAVAALLSKKANAPVMMRITRDDEHHIGRARPALHSRVKVGFRKDGRIIALDGLIIVDNGPYDVVSDSRSAGDHISLCFQPPAMRWRMLTVLTNTPPRGAQRAPGGLQGNALMAPVMAKAARKLGIDEVAIHRINAPEGKAPFGGLDARGNRNHATSAFLKDALDKGAEIFKWQERKARNGQRSGSKVRGVGVAVSAYSAGSIGFDGLIIIKPDGRLAIQSGIGNLGTESVFDVHRVAAEVLDVPWEKCDVTWGNTSKNVPNTCGQGGSQTTHAMTRAAHAAATDAKKKLQEIAAATLGGSASSYQVAHERVSAGGRSMTFAQAAQKAIEMGGKFDGHELPTDINNYTKKSAAALAGQGLMGVARDAYGRDGTSKSYVAGFAEVEVDVETGIYRVLDFLAVADVGTVIHPRVLGGQILGGVMLGFGHAHGQHWVYDQQYGVPLAKRFYTTKPPTILDAPAQMRWVALDLADPETPVGARGMGESPVGAGFGAVVNAISAALGDEIFRRAPVTADKILMALEAGRPMHEALTANV